MAHSVKELKNKHPGADIYVIGSGPSLSYIDKEFFANKIIVCINHTIDFFLKAKRIYVVAKEPNRKMQNMVELRKGFLVTCKHHSGGEDNALNHIWHPDITYIFEPRTNIITKMPDDKSLEKSSSSLVTGLHLAAFMGAKSIILVGHDCGSLDGEVHAKGYDKRSAVNKTDNYERWMSKCNVENKTLTAKKQIEAAYKAKIYSLNPFINFGLEGHVYKPFKSPKK